jgi:hypothetical protein
MNFPCLSLCLTVSVHLSLLLVICNRFTYIAEERTRTCNKHITRDRYPVSLLARRSDLQKTHVTWSLSTVVTSLRTRKTQLPLLLRGLATNYLRRICLRGNLFTNTLPRNGCTCNNIIYKNFSLQKFKISNSINVACVCLVLLTSLLLDLIIYSDDGGNIFLRNIGCLLLDGKAQPVYCPDGLWCSSSFL